MSGSLDYSRFANIGAEEAAQDSAAKSADVQAFKHAVAEAKKAHGAGSDSGEDSEDDEEAFDNPLFWKKLPSQRRHASPRALELEEMFQRMVYEERNADALALDFRERGNHAFKQSQLSEALSLYDEALEWARQMQDSQAQSGEAAVILSNRAQVHLKLGNNRTALRDARAALHLSPGSVKARFRAATAALALNRPDEAVSLCAGEQDPGAKPKLDPLRDKALALKKQAEARARAMERARYEAKRADDAVRKLYRSRPGIKVGRLNMDIRPYTQMEGTPAPVLLLPGASLAWPMLFMYPEHSQSDFVRRADEDSSLKDVLAQMFPPHEFAPWDAGRAYSLDDLELYFSERAAEPLDLTKPLELQLASAGADYARKRWVQVPQHVTVGKLLEHPLYVIPGIPVLVVLSRKSGEHKRAFVEQICRHGCVLGFDEALA